MPNCDLCTKPAEPGQGLYGGRGDGGRSGPKFGELRHYKCHTDKFGKPGGFTLTGALLRAHTQGQMRDLERMTAEPPAPAVKKPKVSPKGNNYNRSPNAAREWRHTGKTISEMGKRRIKIECPFCLTQFWAFVWSISGGGKKCPGCGAMHTSHGNALPLFGNEDL